MAASVTYGAAAPLRSSVAVVIVTEAGYFASGSGTSNDPYIIKTAAQLANLAMLVNAGNATYNSSSIYYQLANDIDLSGYASGQGWNPIGTSTTGQQFQANFDGNWKVVKNLAINRPSSSYIGLFGYANGASIEKLGVEMTGTGVTGLSTTGGLVGQLENSTLTNCYTTGNVTGAGVSNNNYFGGLVGVNHGAIKNCYSTVNVSTNQWYAGGLVGSSNGTIENCYATGNVTGSATSSGSDYGGLVGQNYIGGSISNCYATGDVFGYMYVGGLQGITDGSGTRGALMYSIAANAIVTQTSNIAGNVNRVGGTAFAILTNNSAFEDMVVLLDTATPADIGTIGGNQFAGANVSAEQIKTQSTYTDLTWAFGDTDASPWKMGDASYPLPVLYWQTTYPALPPHLDGGGYFSGGNGTSDYPYIITTPAQLAQLATFANAGTAPYANAGVYYKLGNDIDLSTYLSSGQPGYNSGYK